MKSNRIRITTAQQEKIAVALPYNPTYIKRIKSIKGYHWNPEQKCWIFPKSDNVMRKLLGLFRNENVWIDPSLRREKEDNTIFETLRKEMVSRKYSPKTIKAYIYYNEDLLNFTDKDSKDITERDIKDYLFHLVEEKKVATSTLNSAINALKFYYGTILKKDFIYEVRRPRKDKKLPVVLSKEEIAQRYYLSFLI